MKILPREFLRFLFDLTLVLLVLVMTASFIWAVLTPFDTEHGIPNSTVNQHPSALVNGSGTVGYSERFWGVSGHGWTIGFERKITCLVVKDSPYLSATCFRYGRPFLDLRN